MQEFNPPRYTWTAATVHEAKTVLEAVGDLIDSRLATLTPAAGYGDRSKAARTAPLKLSISLDESELIQLISDRRTLAAFEDTFADEG